MSREKANLAGVLFGHILFPMYLFVAFLFVTGAIVASKGDDMGDSKDGKLLFNLGCLLILVSIIFGVMNGV